MTLTEARNIILQIIKDPDSMKSYGNYAKEALLKGAEALAVNPSDDVVTRESVEDFLLQKIGTINDPDGKPSDIQKARKELFHNWAMQIPPARRKEVGK